MTQPADPARRRFLRGLAQVAGATALAACGSGTGASPSTPDGPAEPPPPPPGPAPLPDGLDRASFHVHNEGPLSLETRRGAHGRGVLTPNDRFFVRNNLPRPSADILEDRDAWVIDLEGVARPGSITLGALKQLGLDSEAVTVQCSGNGRGFFDHGPSGSPWATGAAGTAIWTGVRPPRRVRPPGRRGPGDAVPDRHRRRSCRPMSTATPWSSSAACPSRRP